MQMKPGEEAVRTGYYSLSPPGKFKPFGQQCSTIQRGRLLERLEAASHHRLIIVQGPAGSGKTVLLNQYHRQLMGEAKPCGWLSLDDTDSTAALVMSAFLDAFSYTGLKINENLAGQIFDSLASSEDQAIRLLLLALTQPSSRITLIIDDFDATSVPLVARIIESLIRHIDHLHIILGTRKRATLAQGWLTAAGELVLIQSGELNFDLEEVRRLLWDTVPQDYAGLFHAKTDGMPIAIHLAHRAAQQSKSGHRPPASAASWRDILYDFYREQILEKLPPEIQSFVRRLAIFETFDISLAKAVSGVSAAPLIERLYRTDGLLLRDDRTNLFHFPETLREFLINDFLWLDEDERRSIHLSAAQWYMKRQNYLEALPHAMSAGDSDLALSLFEQVGGSGIILRYGLPLLKFILEKASADTLNQPIFQLSQALLLAQEGNLSEAGDILAKIKTGEEGTPRYEKPQSQIRNILDCEYIIADTLVSGYIDRLPDDSNIAELDAMTAVFPGDEQIFRGLASNLLCWIRYQKADMKGAEAAAQKAISEYVTSNSPYGSLFMHFHRIITQYWQNSLSEAYRECVAAEALVELFYPADTRLRALGRLFRDFILYELGQLDDPSDFISMTLNDISEHEGWIEAHSIAHHTATNALYMSHGAEEALLITAQGMAIADRLEMPRLRWQMCCLEVEILTRSGNLKQARERADRYGFESVLRRKDKAENLSWKEHFQLIIILIRLAIRTNDVDRANEWIRFLEQDACLIALPRIKSKLSIMRALLFDAQNQQNEACKHLSRALSEGMPHPPIALFREEGAPLFKLLKIMALANTDAAVHAVIDQILGRKNQPRMLADDELQVTPVNLTPRELEILTLIEEGSPNKIAAYRLGLSEATIKFHLRKIYRKLNARNRTQALAHYRAMNGDHLIHLEKSRLV